MYVKTFRLYGVKCHYARTLKQSVQNKIIPRLLIVVASSSPNINTLSPSSWLKHELQMI